MHVIWNEPDITPGRIAGYAGCVESVMVCWIQKKHGESDHQWGLVSLNADGMVQLFSGKNGIACYLTNARYVPIELLP